MSNPFMAEIRINSFSFAPKGWALCNGQLLAINQNQPLFALLGTTYGGNGQTTFALPDLRGRVPIHMGSGFTLGSRGGEETHTLTMSEMPAHVHLASSTSSAGTQGKPESAYPANAAPSQIYSSGGAGMQAVGMSPQMISSIGGSQAHENRQPYLALSFCIALQGMFPSQN
jgi:microcystin-dependent protein